MPHPDPLRLQSYGDGELTPASQGEVARHLAECASCRAMVEQWRRAGRALRALAPTSESLRSEGEFWVSLAARLPRRRPEAWPLMPYLPPFLFTALGWFIQGAAYAALLWAAVAWLVPAAGPGALLGEGLQRLLAATPWLPGAAALDALARDWLAMSHVQQTLLALLLLLAFVLAGFVAVAALYLSWVLCWSKEARLHHHEGSG